VAKRTTVGTSVSRVLDDDSIPNSIETGGLISLMTGDPLLPTVEEQVFGSISFKLSRMYNYGRDKYVHGLPSGLASSGRINESTVITTLAEMHNSSTNIIRVIYSYFQPSNYFHFAWMELIRVYEYNPVTNELPVLSASVGFPVFLDDMVLQVPLGDGFEYSAEELALWDTPANVGNTPSRSFTLSLSGLRLPSPIVELDTITAVQALVTYSWATGILANKEFSTSNVIITPNAFEEGASYLHIKYSLGTEIKYMAYDPRTGVYPALDVMVNPPVTANGKFFPFSYFRYDNIPETTDKTSESYIGNKKLLKYLNLDYDDMADSINSLEGAEFVEQAMLVLAVPANSTNPLDQRYLFDFFSTFPDVELFKKSKNHAYFNHTHVIEDKRFKLSLNLISIKKRIFAGSIGEVGTYTFAITSEPSELFFGSRRNEVKRSKQAFNNIHNYRHQISPNFYEEIKIIGLEIRYHVFGKYLTTSFNNDDIRLIPVDYSISQNYGLIVREEFYSRSMHIILNSKQTIKLKWWQTGPVKFLITVVVIVLVTAATIASFGTLGPILGPIFATVLAAAGVAVAWAVIIVITAAIGMVISYVLRKVVALIGIEGSFIAAVILIATAYFYPEGLIFEGVAFGQILIDVTVTYLLEIGLGLIVAIQDYTEDFLRKENKEFELLKEEKYKELDRANALLEDNSNILTPFIVFGETPDEYYTRTIHSGNIGTLTIDFVHDFTALALLLPEHRPTLGGLT